MTQLDKVPSHGKKLIKDKRKMQKSTLIKILVSKMLQTASNRLPPRRVERDKASHMSKRIQWSSPSLASSQSWRSTLALKFTRIACIQLDARASRNCRLNCSKLKLMQSKVAKVIRTSSTWSTASLLAIVMDLDSC